LDDSDDENIVDSQKDVASSNVVARSSSTQSSSLARGGGLAARKQRGDKPNEMKLFLQRCGVVLNDGVEPDELSESWLKTFVFLQILLVRVIHVLAV
jgi:hypothetical protein